MTINTDFNIDAAGNITNNSAFTPGTSVRYTVQALHQWLQDLADNATSDVANSDLVSILGANPSQLAGVRNAVRPAALTLLNGFNISDTTSYWFKFGSVEQGAGATQFSGLKVLGSLVTNSPIYIYQNGAKITKYWADADANSFQILVKVKTASALIPTDAVAGRIVVLSRKYGQTYSHFDTDMSPGSEQVAALSTSLDSNIDTGTMTPAVAAGYFSTGIGGTASTPKIILAYADTTLDLGGGQGALLHKGTITLDGSTSVLQAYQALMWACSESSGILFNSIQGWRARSLDQLRALGAGYTENQAAPFGSFAGGKWFVAQGWWLTGVMAADSKNYQLTSHIGTVETPPNAITLSVSGVIAGDYVLVARDTGTAINTSEYTVSGSIGATSIAVAGLKSDTPVSGVIRINGDRYTYASWSGTTVAGLSPALTQTYTAVPCFIPMIDAVAASTSVSSASMQFASNFTGRFRVRNGTVAPIVPFESTMSVTSTGGSGTAVRTVDV